MPFPPEALIGLILGDRYTITRYIAPGGFCDVYEAEDRVHNRLVALKLLLPGSRSDDIVDFDQEGAILSLLENASQVVDLVESNDATIEMSMEGREQSFPLTMRFHVLELADCCLTELLFDLPAFSWRDRLRLYRGVVKGAHQSDLAEIVHRDHKSENVLVFASSETTADAKIADFGRARILSEASRLSPADYVSGRGDLRFAPPEMLWCVSDGSHQSWRRAELYLLGSVLFELGTGLGLTAQSLGNPAKLVENAMSSRPELRKRRFDAQMPQIRTLYEEAYSLFADEVPASIRYESLRLLRTLTDPDPSKRRPGIFGSRRRGGGLSWIIRRVDILALSLSRAEAEAERLAARRQERTRSRNRGLQ